MGKVAVVVPSIRPECLRAFREAWAAVFAANKCELFAVLDGDDPAVQWNDFRPTPLSAFPQTWRDVVFNRTDACRNLGFLFALKNLGRDLTHVVTLDDDVRPHEGNDPVREHLAVLGKAFPVSWFSTADRYMRGFPYGVRTEAPAAVSHGVWEGVHDYDGPTQLVNGNRTATFYRGVVPKGCLTPVCGMNLAWTWLAMPHVYFAPMGKQLGVQRFADIWMGVCLKRWLDSEDLALVTGYSTVLHERASNVFANLEAEARGIALNERWWREGDGVDPYFAQYADLRRRWQDLVAGLT